MKVFSDNLRRRAEELNLSNAEVARRAGLAERRYGNYVTGRREPDLSTLLRIASVLGRSVQDLLSPDTPEVDNERTILERRLTLAASSLTEAELRLVLVQIEALAAHAEMR